MGDLGPKGLPQDSDLTHTGEVLSQNFDVILTTARNRTMEHRSKTNRYCSVKL